MRSRVRWWVASMLGRLSGQCWSDLVSWAEGWDDRRWPWSPVGWMCRQDARECGRCYCGRLRAEAGEPRP